MSTNRRKFTDEFKADAVQLVVQGQRSIAQVARELGINESSLGYWVKAYRVQHPDPETAPPPVEAARVARLEAELRTPRCLRATWTAVAPDAVFTFRTNNPTDAVLTAVISAPREHQHPRKINDSGPLKPESQESGTSQGERKISSV